MAKMVCGKVAHTHSNACSGNGKVCGIPEHTHDSSCMIGD